MNNGKIEMICGDGAGKTSLAVGKGISALLEHKNVIMIQFLKGNQKKEENNILKVLEPYFKIFRFEKAEEFYEELSEDEKKEELINIKNGFNFAKKVAATGECDLLILDEILGLIDQGIITTDDLKRLMETKEEDMNLILTGKVLSEELKFYADEILVIDHIEVDKAFLPC